MTARSARARLERAILYGAPLVLTLLHLDFWRPQRPRLIGGWIPEELAWRVIWMLLAWGYMLFVCSRVWRIDEPADDDTDA